MGLTWDIRDKGDRRTELANGFGKGEHGPCDDAGPHQGQGHREINPRAACAQSGGGFFQLGIDVFKRQADRAHHQGEAHDGSGQGCPGPFKGEDQAETLLEKLP